MFSAMTALAAFGVPEEIVTTTDKAKYDVMQGARLNFIEKQLDRFYSPMLGLRTEIETATRFRKIVGDHAAAAWRELTRDAREVSQDRLIELTKEQEAKFTRLSIGTIRNYRKNSCRHTGRCSIYSGRIIG